MYFSTDALEEMRSKTFRIESIYEGIVKDYNSFNFQTDRAREFAMHGLSRRLHTMSRSIEVIFSILPPEQSEPPEKDILSDSMINIQSFVFNTFGAIDNIAWIWTSETGQKDLKGDYIPDKFVGLGPKNKSVRRTLSKSFQKYLESIDKWFDSQTALRHALAHRIPIYIPPYIIHNNDSTKYQELSEKIKLAFVEKRWPDWQQLKTERDTLKTFIPLIQQSFYEEEEPIEFHPQMIADFLTVEQIARHMLQQLNEIREAK